MSTNTNYVGVSGPYPSGDYGVTYDGLTRSVRRNEEGAYATLRDAIASAHSIAADFYDEDGNLSPVTVHVVGPTIYLDDDSSDGVPVSHREALAAAAEGGWSDLHASLRVKHGYADGAKYTVTVQERRTFHTFGVTVYATDEEHAKRMAHQLYPVRLHYSVQHVDRVAGTINA